MQIEALNQKVNNSVKRRPSHRKRRDDGKSSVHRVGSVLSDYTKPTIIRRSKDDPTSSDEDFVDGRVMPVIRVSGDGGSNEDGEPVNTCTSK